MFAVVMFNDKMELCGNVYHDRDCGYVMGKIYSPERGLASATFFTREAAQEVFDRMCASKPHSYSDGTVTPPSHIWTGLDISFENPKASGHFAIVEVQWKVVQSIAVEGKITR